ncbi:helix-turn-helix domain-containing protein [Pseudarthrobacter sp. O4]|uniref:helix-turn-helix domain-containing protein n=1 Tax=Pseudarthrobacter sp. O4 TaxID=3418417 RepID=UPI003CEA89E5
MSKREDREMMLVRVGQLIRQRREESGLSRGKFAEVAGIGSLTTVQNAETGAFEVSAINQPKFEKALDWAPGAIRRAMDKVGEVDPNELTMKAMDGDRVKPVTDSLQGVSFEALLAEVSRRYRVELARGRALAGPHHDEYDPAVSDDMTGGDDGE